MYIQPSNRPSNSKKGYILVELARKRGDMNLSGQPHVTKTG